MPPAQSRSIVKPCERDETIASIGERTGRDDATTSPIDARFPRASGIPSAASPSGFTLSNERCPICRAQMSTPYIPLLMRTHLLSDDFVFDC